MQKFRDIKACASVKTRRRENVKFTVTNCKDRFKLQLLAYEYQNQSPAGILPKRCFIKISQNSQKNTFDRVCF